MKMNRPLCPGFIKRWDEDLLLNKPDTWSTRAHLVLYYCLLFMAALTVICFVVPNDPREYSHAYLWVIFVSLISFVGFIVWLIFLLRFNVFKRFGNLGQMNGLKTFMLYFFCIAGMVLCPFIPPVVESIRANMSYSSREIADDINGINSRILLLEHDSIPLSWQRDTIRVVNDLKERRILVNENDYVTNSQGEVIRGGYKVIDTAEFNKRVHSVDSLQKINDSVYLFFECPDYQFVNTYLPYSYGSDHAMGGQWTSVDLYHHVLERFKRPDKSKTRKELEALLMKYAPEKDQYSYYTSSDNGYKNRISNKYMLSPANTAIYNIVNRMYRWDDMALAVSLRAFYYVTLVLALFVFIYRRSSLRTFFLSLLAAILITIFTSLAMAMFNIRQISTYVLWLVYYAVFCILAFQQSGKTRNVFNGISLNFFVLCTPFIPLIIVAMIYDAIRSAYRMRNEVVPTFDNEVLHYLLAEIAGFVLLLLLMTFVFRQLYRRWFATPEQ